jgi:hypothetical protein
MMSQPDLALAAYIKGLKEQIGYWRNRSDALELLLVQVTDARENPESALNAADTYLCGEQ